MIKRLKRDTVLILKKDHPPYPAGTEFTISYGCVDDLYLHSPNFGTILPNGKKIDSMAVGKFNARFFDDFGGWFEWFEVKNRVNLLEWGFDWIKFTGEPLDKVTVDKIIDLINENYNNN